MREARLAAIAAAIEAGELVEQRHALLRMGERRLVSADLRAALCTLDTEIVEDYPTDPRGACCLVPCYVHGRPCHAVISYPPFPLLITAYWPDERPVEWEPACRRRKQP